MLENLKPAQKIDAPKDFRPAIEFDGTEGVATLPSCFCWGSSQF
jgi:hypothetical protein